MIRLGGLGLLLAAAVWLFASAAQAEPVTYTIAIGNNAAPASDGSGAQQLRYADDDAVRYAELFGRLGPVWLLSRLDEKTARRHPEWRARSLPPTRQNLRQTVSKLVALVKEAHKRGDSAQVLLTFSGHGLISDQGEYYLALDDGPLTRSALYDEVLEPLRGARVHLIVDACHAAGVVGVRGAFDHELEARTVGVDDADRRALVSRYSLERFPNVGVLIASTPGQEAHEWSRIEGGVFTYEVTSALLGAADLNSDLRIEYGEVAAFVAAANQALENPDAAPHLVARAPRDGALLVDLTQLDRTLLLTGSADKLGRFYIELSSGERWLAAHVPPSARVTLALPIQRGSFVRAGDQEAEIPLAANGVVRLENLRFVPSQFAARGSVERALERDLFALPFDRDAYSRFAAASDLPQVRFGGPPRDLPARFVLDTDAAPHPSKTPAIALGVTAGAAAVTALVSTSLGLRAYSQFRSEERQRQATELRSDVVVYRNVALAAGAVAIGAGAGAWLAWPAAPRTRVTASGAGLSLTHDF